MNQDPTSYRPSSGGRRRRKGCDRSKDLLIAWNNTGRQLTAHLTFLSICENAEVDVAHVQEPWWRPGTKTQNHPAYDLYAPVDSWDTIDDRPRVLTYVRKRGNLQVQQRRPLETRDMLWLDVNNIAMLNCYRAPNTDEVIDYVTALELPNRCLIGGDFNAHESMWEPGIVSDHRGAELAQWSLHSGATYIGQPGMPTQRRGHVLDLTFSNIPFANTERRRRMRTGSDHETLLTTIPGRGIEQLEQFHYRVKDDDLPVFIGLIQNGMEGMQGPESLGTAEALDEAAEAFGKMWKGAIETAGSLVRPASHAAPWWTDECKEAWKRWKASESSYLVGQDPFTEERREFLSIVRTAKRDYWRKVLEEAQDGPELYRIIGWHKLSPNLKSPPLLIDGQTIEGGLEKAEALQNKILKRYTARDDLDFDPLEGWLPNEETPGLEWNPAATLEEIEKHTIGISSTSPGVDGTTVRLLSWAWEHVKHWIHGFAVQCLKLVHIPTSWKQAEVSMIPKPGKKDKTSYRSYRPIALLSCWGKGLERLLAKRMAWQALAAGIISPQQAGALPKRSAMDLVASLTHDVEWALSRGQKATIATLDVQGAFDALLPRRLLKRMREQGWALPWLQMVQTFLSGRRVRTRFEGRTTDYTDMECGTPQGSPWSPVLFLMYLLELLNMDRNLRYGYADDIGLCRTGRTLDDTTAAVEEDIRGILDWGDENKVFFAPEKCEAIHCTREKGKYSPDIAVRDNFIIHPVGPHLEEEAGTNKKPLQPALRWLGMWFDRKLSFRRHVQERCLRAMKLARHLRSLANTKYGPPPSALRKAVTTCVIPTVLYGAEAWYGGRSRPAKNPSQTGAAVVSAKVGWHIDQVQKAINWSARAVLPVWKTTPNNTLCRDAGLPTAELALEEARLRFALRLQKVDEQHPLVRRMLAPMIARGRGAGSRMRPVTKVQRAALELPEVDRPDLAIPRYPEGSRAHPTEKVSKKRAAEAFKEWEQWLSPREIVVYSDGSKDAGRTGYGYVIYKDGRQIAAGQASLDDLSEVFDAEAIGAWKGLEKALSLPEYLGDPYTVWVCLDNTSAIWGLRGNAPTTSQWAFRRFHKAVSEHDVRVKWCPGHMGITGNEAADEAAKEGLKAARDTEAKPTAAGIKGKMGKQLRVFREEHWKTVKEGLSANYKKWKLDYNVECLEELTLSRQDLHRYLAVRTGHGDFAWYHRKYHHEDAKMECSCGHQKTPEHLVHCHKTRRHFAEWPWPSKERPKRYPVTRQEREEYLRDLMWHPEAFRDYIAVTAFYSDICPR